tara:strand:- start:42 stop:1028 length:987 start_codon:yes stop_codon:yes gene_type:complete
MFKGKSILISGGTGTYGKCAIKYLLKHNPKKIIVFSRDEFKQYNLSKEINDKKIRYFIGDVRDYERVEYALKDVDILIHAAALKQVPSSEYNPTEAIRTNINGAENIIRAAIKCNVKKVMALSTDKATNPINLYGATKLCSDKLFVAANNYSGGRKTIFSITRYGNVFGSRGSVLDTFENVNKKKLKFFPITDKDMTRFWITIEDGVKFSMQNIIRMKGGEIFVPKIPSVKITDLAKAYNDKIPIKITGLRPGEKVHEVMVPRDSSHHTLEFKDHYVIAPEFEFVKHKNFKINNKREAGKKLPHGFEYNSFNNPDYLKISAIKKKLSF